MEVRKEREEKRKVRAREDIIFLLHHMTNSSIYKIYIGQRIGSETARQKKGQKRDRIIKNKARRDENAYHDIARGRKGITDITRERDTQTR